jgi:hypothetical protein
MGLNLSVFNGTLVDRQDSRLLFQVRAASGSSAFGEQPLYQRLALSPPDVLRIDVRQLNKPRTAGLVAVLAGAATLIAIKIIGHRRPGMPGGGGPPPE